MTTLAEDAAALRELRKREALLKDDYEVIKDERERAESLLFARMDSERVGSIKVDDTNFVRAETVYGQVQDRAEFVRWAQENEPELLETKERKKLVNEMVRTCIDDGQELPPGLGYYTNEYISLRAG